MSLLLTSSNWVSDEPPKKRIPTIRKTMKTNHGPSLETDKFSQINSVYSDDGNRSLQEYRSSKVNDLLEKMSSLKNDDEGDYLENFTSKTYEEMDSGIDMLPNSYIANNHDNDKSIGKMESFTSTNGFVNENNVHTNSNFNNIYDSPMIKPTYPVTKDAQEENKVMERLSYIIHLLEQQQNEKTNHVLEEFILYILLGTFVIFVVDSFSRGGKYIR